MPLKPIRAFGEPATRVDSASRLRMTAGRRSGRARRSTGATPAQARVLGHKERGVAVLGAQELVEFGNEVSACAEAKTD